MVAEHLTVRNLTSTPITLKRIERFRAHEKPKDEVKSLAQNFTQLLSNVTGGGGDSHAHEIVHDKEPFFHKDVSIRVEPFQTHKTELKTFLEHEKERIRWVFEVEGERHEITTPVPTAESATMKALCDNPRFRFTGVYVHSAAHLAIYSSAHMDKWMGELKDNILLSSLSIPGTHNSPACHVAPPSVRCQAASPKEQLQNGVRFFDIRVQPEHPEDPSQDGLILVHSVFPISLTGNKYFRDLMHDVNEFLDHNPSETVIISLKREGPGEHTDQQLSRIVSDHYARPDNKRWYTDPKIPTLGEARNKVVLIRRFDILEKLREIHQGRGWAINAAGWPDNCDNGSCPSGEVCIQDFYEVLETENIDKKIKYVTEHCARAGEHRYPFGILPDPAATRAHPFYINFLSASNFWKLDTWPEKIAAKVNPATVDYLCCRHCEKDGDWSTGILVTDWVGKDGDWDLVRCIVGMNARLKLRREREDHR